MTGVSYTLQQIENISFSDFKYKLPERTLKILDDIERKVGSPNYVKTPNFKKRRNNYGDENWDSIRSFKTTKINEASTKEEEIILEIKKILNKMTQTTFEDNCMALIELMDTNEAILNENNMKKISNIIFTTGINNSLLGDVFAELYKVLMNKYEIMIDVFDENLQSFMKVFDNIEYVSPDEDYDRFCEINKINEKRTKLSSFFVSLMKIDVIGPETIVSVILNLQNMIIKMYKNKEDRNKIDEICENMFILITKGKEQMRTVDSFHVIEKNVTDFSNINKKEYPGMTNKSIFKNMDILDDLKV
jgi:hypothetical protein